MFPDYKELKERKKNVSKNILTRGRGNVQETDGNTICIPL